MDAAFTHEGLSIRTKNDGIPGKLTSEDAAKILGFSRPHVIAIAKRGLLIGTRTPGGHWRFSETAVLQYRDFKIAQANGFSKMVNSSVELGMYTPKVSSPEKGKNN